MVIAVPGPPISRPLPQNSHNKGGLHVKVCLCVEQGVIRGRQDRTNGYFTDPDANGFSLVAGNFNLHIMVKI